MSTWVISGTLIRLIVVVGALALLPLWKRWTPTRKRTWITLAAGVSLLALAEATTLVRAIASVEALDWPSVYLHGSGYIAIFVGVFFWVRDVYDSGRHAKEALDHERHQLAEVRLNEAKLQAVLNCASEYCIIVCDTDGRITSYSAGGTHVFGWSPDEVNGRMHVADLHPEGRGHDAETVFQAVRQQGSFEREIEMRRKDGATFPALLTVSDLRADDGTELGFLGIAKDISSLKQVQEALKHERDFVQGIIETSDVFIVGVSLADGRITMFNRGAEKISGYRRDEVVGKPYIDLLVPPDDKDWAVAHFTHIRDKADSPIDYLEGPILTKDGARRIISWTSNLCTDDEGHGTHVVQFGHDMTEHREMQASLESAKAELEKANEELKRVAATDFLTGLVNRRQATLQVQREIARCRRTYQPIGVVMIDLDRFKPVNDTYGHHAGDLVLAQVARVLKQRARASDIVARYGGEEFLVVLPEADLDATVKVATAFKQLVIESPVDFEGTEIPIRASFGVTVLRPGEALSVQDIISRADEALYAAKGLGGNRVVTWNDVHGGTVEPLIGDSEVIQTLHKEVEEITRQNQEALVDGLTNLVKRLEGNSPYTDGHSVRVTEYAVGIAREMGLDEKAVQNIERAGLLHDLGKTGVPEEVLFKNGSLTLDDWALVMQHPAVSCRIVADLPFLKPTLPLIRHHHERPDGRGYPDGLSAEAIPLGARILAVADAMDAMTSPRPYREALSPEAMRAELQSGAGRVFNEAVVEAALACLDREEAWPLKPDAAAEPVGTIDSEAEP